MHCSLHIVLRCARTPTPNPEGSSAMGQVSGRRAARAPFLRGGTSGWIARGGDGNSVSGAASVVGVGRSEYYLFSLTSNAPVPALMAAGVGARTAAPWPAAVRCRRALTPGPKPFRAIDRSQRPAHRLRRDWRPCSHGKTTAVAETASTPFGRGMSPRRRGRIPETSGESIYQRIALARTFYPRRRRCRSRHAGLPPDSSATAWKTTPRTL
jgi:hypothetical protein